MRVRDSGSGSTRELWALQSPRAFCWRLDGSGEFSCNDGCAVTELAFERFDGSWVMPYATDVDVPDASKITDSYGWLVCAGGPPLSGVSRSDG